MKVRFVTNCVDKLLIKCFWQIRLPFGILNAVSGIVLKILLTVMEIMCVLKHLSPLSCNTGQFSPPENKTFSCKLRCYTRFPNPEKSRNTREKKKFFSRVFNIANQLLKRHSPFAPLGHVDEWRTKPLPFLIQGRLSDYFRIMAAKKMKNPYRLQTVTFELS